MSKIIINEIDNTARAVGEYQNFSVVVPGFIADNITENKFDDNGILEVNRLSDFTKYIGKTIKGTEGAVSVKAPVLSNFSEEGETPVINYSAVEAKDFYGKYDECLYTAKKIIVVGINP